MHHLLRGSDRQTDRQTSSLGPLLRATCILILTLVIPPPPIPSSFFFVIDDTPSFLLFRCNRFVSNSSILSYSPPLPVEHLCTSILSRINPHHCDLMLMSAVICLFSKSHAFLLLHLSHRVKHWYSHSVSPTIHYLQRILPRQVHQ